MDYTEQAIIYGLLLLPTLFALSLVAQGFVKMSRKEENAKTELGFGIFFLLIIVFAYAFFIR